MSLKSEIIPYIDGNNLVAPNIVPPKTKVGSDNGPMFTAEYLIMLLYNGEMTTADVFEHYVSEYGGIGSCITNEGMLSRVPRGQIASQTGPDDYYGVINLSKHFGDVGLPRGFLKALIRYMGFLNNNNPGQWTKSAFLVRQPQLVCAMVTAAFPSFINPIHILIRLLCFPLYAITAAIIATSCINEPVDSTDPRRLSWHLVQTVKSTSLLCFLASLIWYNRLHNDYLAGMKSVAYIYYSQGHPFSKYWVD